MVLPWKWRDAVSHGFSLTIFRSMSIFGTVSSTFELGTKTLATVGFVDTFPTVGLETFATVGLRTTLFTGCTGLVTICTGLFWSMVALFWTIGAVHCTIKELLWPTGALVLGTKKLASFKLLPIWLPSVFLSILGLLSPLFKRTLFSKFPLLS